MLRETFQEFLIWMSKTDPDPSFSHMDTDPTFFNIRIRNPRHNQDDSIKFGSICMSRKIMQK